MTSTLAAANKNGLLAATVAFLTDHLGHRISTYNRHRDKRSYWTHAHIDPRADRAYEPYERPWWLKGPDTDAYGPSRSIRSVFAEADELTCTECHVSREWLHAHAAALAELRTIAARYQSGPHLRVPVMLDTYLSDARRMAALIAALTD